MDVAYHHLEILQRKAIMRNNGETMETRISVKRKDESVKCFERSRGLDIALLLILLMYSASVAGEETLHKYSYVQSHKRHTVKNKNLIK